MTVKDQINAILDASDAGARGLGVFEPSITRARRNKRGFTTITLEIRVTDFTPEDVLRGMVVWLAIGTVAAVTALEDAAASPPQEPT